MDPRSSSASDLVRLISFSSGCVTTPSDASPQASIATTTETRTSAVSYMHSAGSSSSSSNPSSRQSTLRRQRLNPSVVIHLRHQASTADSLCRSETGTNEVSVTTTDYEGSGSCSGDSAQMIADCLLQVLQQAGDGLSDSEDTAQTIMQDCCVYANCNCTLGAATTRAAAVARKSAVELESSKPKITSFDNDGVGGDKTATKGSVAAVENVKSCDRYMIDNNSKKSPSSTANKSGGCKCCCIS
ncbi:hypothetical protein BOX15_Mlig009271g1 [Macrostomum lignano]|uniref:Uncharacterized protein n=1 Tax=Macrostomum lignano TaxID=282301 RepID=A0A267FAH6_9PLAT|nr:hypothetical protein BOX15_Mlig009271g1 [Macrostomum lignano]